MQNIFANLFSYKDQAKKTQNVNFQSFNMALTATFISPVISIDKICHQTYLK